MGDFSFGEMIVVAIIAIVIYGKELPQVARKMASIYTKLRRQLTDIKDEIQRQIPPEDFKVNLDPSLTSEPPTVPTGLTAMTSGDRVLLTWNSSVGATSYTLKRASGEGQPHYVLASGLSELSYYDSDISPGVTYSWVISASNSAGESSDSDPATLPPPEPPSPDAAAPIPSPPPIAEPPPLPPAPEAVPGGNGHGSESPVAAHPTPSPSASEAPSREDEPAH